MNNIDLQEQSDNAKKLIKNQKTLLISSVSDTGQPECSYAPYVRDLEGVFYIFVSELANHTQNMLHNPQVSLLFIQPEKEAKNLFARERMVFECAVTEIKQNDANFDVQLDVMSEKLGEIIDLLRSLSDFHLLALTPVSGKYVAGFGRAYSMNMTEGLSSIELT